MSTGPVYMQTRMQGLGGAHATVAPITGHTALAATIGNADVKIELLDEPHLIRQLLTDALAQLDAIEAGR
jgi:hypothetical protein